LESSESAADQENYRKKTLKLNNQDIRRCKTLFDERGVKYIQAVNEADDVCCELFSNGTVSGVFTEDNDLLIGGAMIYKGLNNSNDVVFRYDIETILNELGMCYDVFLQLCLLSGSTYTKKVDNIFNIYNQYKTSNTISNVYSDKATLYNKYVKQMAT